MANEDDVRNPSQGGSPSASESRRHIDTALIIAAVSASCYCVGHWVQLREIHQLGVPPSLLAEGSEHPIILNGAFSLLLTLLAIITVAFIISLASRMAVPATLRRKIEQDARTLVDRHPKFSLVLCILSLILLVRIVVCFGPLITASPFRIVWSSKDASYKDVVLPRVVGLHLKDGQSKISDNDLLYLSRRDGCFLFKRAGTRQYLVIREENIKLLVLDSARYFGGTTPNPALQRPGPAAAPSGIIKPVLGGPVR